ncbi:JHY protein, partial [Hemiprocne comata]|nr:JHY protein [Hemiprocne comata]
ASSQESHSESLVQERQYQLELQQWIHENEELVGLSFDELDSNSLEEDSLEEMNLEEQEGAECDTNPYTTGIQKDDGNGRKQQALEKYFSLRYNPSWKNTKEVGEVSEAEKACQDAGGSSGDFSQDPFYLHSNGFPEEKNQQEAKSQDSPSEFGPKMLILQEPNGMVSKEPSRLHSQGKAPAGGCHFRGHPSAASLQIQQARPQRAKKDFVEKNKRALGIQAEKINSYLQLHSKKQEVLQEQITDPKTVDEEPVQCVQSSQTEKMKPEDKWNLKAQQLNDHQNKFSQRNKTKGTRSLKGRAFPRGDSQQPLGRPAEPRAWHHRHHQGAAVHTAPMQAVERDNSSTLQKQLDSSPSVGLGTDTAANPQTCFHHFPNSRHFVNQDFPACPFHPPLHKFNPGETRSPAHTSKKSKKHQHDSPNGLPHHQQHLYNHVPVQLFPRDNSTNGQAHPNQRNISSTFNANLQELLKDQVSLQDCKRHIYMVLEKDSSILWALLHIEFSTIESFLLRGWKVKFEKQEILISPPLSSQSSVHSSPTALCTTSQSPQRMEQHHQEIPLLPEAHLADRHLCSLLPPVIPQRESASGAGPESGEGNQLKISQSNSEGYLIQMERQKQPQVSKKPWSSKGYMNLPVELGGLGPDYEAIKEKKEKLKQQKEYAKQIREYNMKNTASVPRLPAKPQVVSSTSRQKALEYAKKIPRPRNSEARQSDEEVKEERVLPRPFKGDSLLPIESLETLQNRHKNEKQVVAAFRTLHIL